MNSAIVFQGKDKPAQPCPPQPNDTCTIMYTSGTSGQPKGVMLSHESHGMYVKGVDLFMDQFDDKVTCFYQIE
jgi:long-chain acyl-CoA synthetase